MLRQVLRKSVRSSDFRCLQHERAFSISALKLVEIKEKKSDLNRSINEDSRRKFIEDVNSEKPSSEVIDRLNEPESGLIDGLGNDPDTFGTLDAEYNEKVYRDYVFEDDDLDAQDAHEAKKADIYRPGKEVIHRPKA